MVLVRREHNKVAILEVCGEVDIHSAKSLRMELEKLPCAEQNILLNLSQTYYIDSIGLSLLISFKKKQCKNGKQFGICSPQSYMKRILNLTRLTGALSIFENEYDAIQAFSEGFA